VVGKGGLTGGSCASEAEGENSHGDYTMALAAVDGGVGCENVGYRFRSVRLGGHVDLLKGISQCDVGRELLSEEVDLYSVTDMWILCLKGGPL
jgi:hypothetical protein